MPSEEVVELSIQETNELRIKLGLAPLRTEKDASVSNSDGADELSSTKAKKKDIHAPAPDTAKLDQAKARIEERKVAREVESRLKNNFAHTTLGANDNESTDATSWAERMRQKPDVSKSKAKNKKKNKKLTDSYTSKDLDGIEVSHNVSAFDTNAETILTLADESILQRNENKVTIGLNDEHKSRLENVEMTGAKKTKENLRKKRRIEMGQGHAGGYAAWDDDEFDEMGGIGGGMDYNDDYDKLESGFLIGQKNDIKEDENTENSFFGKNKKVSLDSSSWQKGNVMASDFMTTEEYEKEREAKKKKKKEKGFKKTKKSKKKESKKKHRRKKIDDDSDEEKKESKKTTESSLLHDLESSAVEINHNHNRKRRKRENDDDQNKEEIKSSVRQDRLENSIGNTEIINGNKNELEEDDLKSMHAKRAKFDAVMEKGNQRSKQAFSTVISPTTASKPVPIEQNKNEGTEQDYDNEEDDAFLNAALAKARRLQKLKKLNGNNNKSINKDSSTGESNVDDKKAKSIVEALQSSTDQNQMKDQSKEASSNRKGITFEFDPTREFTRALRARESQSQRQSKPKSKGTLILNVNKKKQDKTNDILEEPLNVAMDVDMEEEEEDIEKLSEQVSTQNNDEDIEGLNFTSQSNLLVNRGLSSTLSLLKTTGSLASNNTKNSSLQEKLRGRAKDRRNYEDYESLDLAKVTSIGSSRERKDKEFSKREIKLEYRDEYGRLLTSKEAYRQMCYQFHGHGSGKKNEERRIKLIERERMEEAGGSAGIGDGLEKKEGTLGALKATQRVTGKAFIVHKT